MRATSRTCWTRPRAKRRCVGSTYPASMNPRVFFAHRQGLARFTSPHLSFMKLCRSRRARASRCLKFSRLISRSSAPIVSLTSKISPRMLGQALLAVETEQHPGGAADSRFIDEQSYVDRNGALIRRVEVGSGIECVGVTPERQSFRFTATAFDVQDMVDHDAIEPCPKATAPLERRESRKSFDQDLLRGILGVRGVVKHSDGDVVDPRLMTTHQSF